MNHRACVLVLTLPVVFACADQSLLPSAVDTSPMFSAGQVKVSVCHVTDTYDFGYGLIPVGHVITIADPAYDSHLAHGDPSSYVVRMLPDGKEACTPVDSDNDGVPDVDDCDPTVANADSYGGHMYMVCQGQLDRPQAVTACTDAGFNLAYIDDEAENTWVVDFAISLYGLNPWPEEATTYWIANLKSSPPQTTWPSGNPVWAWPEPTGDGIYIQLIRYYAEPYGWNDVPDSWTWGWVCESP